MTENPRSAEFEARIDAGGTITLPAGLARTPWLKDATVHVRVTVAEEGRELRARGITEEEIDRIARTQLETREQVVKFLLSEGALRKSRLAKRVKP